MRNYLQDAASIKNSNICRYDGRAAYSTDFSVNGDPDGWTLYNNICLYGCWEGILFGTSTDNEISLARPTFFAPIPTDDYYLIRIMMKLTVEDERDYPTKGKVRWLTLNDDTWDSNKEQEFDLIIDDKWHLYTINVGPSYYWQGDVNNLKIYPFIDGRPHSKFAIQYIKIDSEDTYLCSNSNCSYYLSYEHPCPGAGVRPSIIAGEAKSHYTTVSGVNDTLYINIDDYGSEVIRLGTNINYSGKRMARKILDCISKVGIGGYTYAEIEHNFYEKLQITSGNVVKNFDDDPDSYEIKDKDIFLVTCDEILKDAAYFTERKIEIEEYRFLHNTYVVKGSMEELFKLGFVPNAGSAGWIDFKQGLEYNGIFSNITLLQSFRGIKLAQVADYRSYREWRTHRASTEEPTTIHYLGSIYDRYSSYSGNWYDPNGIRDCNSTWLILNPHVQAYTDPPEYNYSNNCEYAETAGNYFYAKLMVWNTTGYAFTWSHTGSSSDIWLSNEDIDEIPEEHKYNLYYLGHVQLNNRRKSASVEITGGTAATELGFKDSNGNDISEYIEGIEPASGFDYAASRRLKGFEINKLSSNTHNQIAYLHNPKQFNVEAGRRDFSDSSTSNRRSKSFTDLEVFKVWKNRGSTIIDITHPFNDSGRVSKIYVNGTIQKGSYPRVFIVRPYKDGTFKAIYEFEFQEQGQRIIYTTQHVTYRIDCDVIVNKGDCIAVYDVNVLVPTSFTREEPNATYYQFAGRPSFQKFDPGLAKATGVTGFAVYARSNRLQTNILLDIDLGERVNVDTLHVYGREKLDYFEYNIAMCLDLNWTTNLYGEYHTHPHSHYYGSFHYEYHQNIAYGTECLNDGITTPDNGVVAKEWSKSSNGTVFAGKPAYFFVNGDAEWLHNGANDSWRKVDDRYEFSWDVTSASTIDYKSDPVSLLLTFPNNNWTTIHKTVMYFKEPRNFKSFSISTYMGESLGYLGNELLPNYVRIPNYNYIRLDDIEYRPEYSSLNEATEITSSINEIMFNNPTKRVVPEYRNGIITNWHLIQTNYNLEWNILEHGFDDILCRGINVTAYYHESTKICEIEVFSKFPIDPTLVDNITGYYSDYGTYWNDMNFSDVEDDHIQSYTGSAPRYFTLDITSQSEFELYGIALETSDDDLELGNCENTLLLEDAPSGRYSQATAIEIENTFDREYDLIVNLPVNVESTNQMVYWSKLGSENELLYPEVGPGGILHKKDNYIIKNRGAQCAINCNSFGLKNIAIGKKTYVSYDPDVWENYTTISGQHQRLGLTNNANSMQTSFSVTPVSNRYWKIIASDGSCQIESIHVYLNGEKQKLDTVYSGSAPDNTKQNYEITTETGYDLGGFIFDATVTGSMGFALDISSDGVDQIYIRHTGTISSSFDLYISSANDNSYFYWCTATGIVDSAEYENYFAIDLEDGFYLDIVRNYGPSDNIFFISVSSNIQTSASQTSNINDVEWVPGAPSIVLNWKNGIFENYVDEDGDDVFVEQLGTPEIVDNDSMFDSYSLYLDGSSVLELEYGDIFNDFSFKSDFTIHWWEKREQNTTSPMSPYLSNFGASTCSFQVGGDYYGVYRAFTDSRRNYSPGICAGYWDWDSNRLVVIFRDANYHLGHLELDSDPSNSLNKWVHYAITKRGNTYRSFRNGVLIDTINFSGKIDIYYGNRDTISFGRQVYYSSGTGGTYYAYFKGYIDEFIFIDGAALWTANFSPPGNQYVQDEPEDIRWIKIGIINGDGVDRELDMLGVYPNTSRIYTTNSNYNCEWQELGNKLADYDVVSRNVAEGATTVSASSYITIDFGDHIEEWTPYNAFDGVKYTQRFNDCWGFEGSDPTPTLEIDLEEVYTINKIKLYHGDNTDSGFMNNDYDVYYKPDDETDYSLLFSISGNNSRETGHTFSAVTAKHLKLVITAYETPDNVYAYSTTLQTAFKIDGGFLREMEVYTLVGGGEINSEDWPVVCMDMRDYFGISYHKLMNNHWYQPYGYYAKPYMLYTWSNDEEFFKYSDSSLDQPERVAFQKLTAEGNFTYFTTSDEHKLQGTEGTIYQDNQEIYFDYGIYFDIGRYDVTWKAFNAEYGDLISLVFSNNDETIELFADILNSGWQDQSGQITVYTAGEYDISARISVDAHDNWGAGTIVVTRIKNEGIRWVSLKRDTATNYAWTNLAEDKGVDYLDRIEIYNDGLEIITEYRWWWKSTLSTLSNDSLLVKVGRRSLRMNYPASSEMDRIELIEACDFGKDKDWSEMDFFCFWLYISDLDKLDTDWGGVYFGSCYKRDIMTVGYYEWDFRDIEGLQTGWNRVRLRFDSFAFSIPVPNAERKLKPDLNFRDKHTSSFGIIYRGKGQSFFMCLDDLRIERNYYDDDVKFGKGLCLSHGEFLDIPLTDVSPSHGCVEFWAKLYTDSEGTDVFNETASRNLMSIVNNNNELVSLGIRSGSWFEAGFGRSRTDYNALLLGSTIILPSQYFIGYKEKVHLALAWSHDGSLMNGTTARLYVNGDLMLSSKTTWDISDTKSVSLRFGGGASVIAYNNDPEGSAIFDNVKVYNYCKDNFNINQEGFELYNYLTPNHFLEISKDNINFYGINSGSLPLVFEDVPASGTRTVYIRTNKDDRYKEIRKTAELEIGWITAV